MKIPILSTDAVFHIGTLDKSNRGSVFHESYEGNLLSVSNCPESWRHIAKLGDSHCFEIRDTGRLKFLDVLEIGSDVNLRNSIESWAVSEGYAEIKLSWKSWTFDTELEDWIYSIFESEIEANEECDQDEETGPNGCPLVEEVEMLAGTDRLALLVKSKSVLSQDSFDMCLIAWASDLNVPVHGLWWRDEHDVSRLSAPRGGIFPYVLPELEKASCKFDEIDEYPEELDFSFLSITKNHTP